MIMPSSGPQAPNLMDAENKLPRYFQSSSSLYNDDEEESESPLPQKDEKLREMPSKLCQEEDDEDDMDSDTDDSSYCSSSTCSSTWEEEDSDQEDDNATTTAWGEDDADFAHSGRRSRVRFGEIQVHYVAPLYEQAPKLELWYSRDEQVALRQVYMKDAKHVAHTSGVCDSAMYKIFVECSKGEGSDLHPQLVEELRHYLQDETHTGLERMAARQIYNDKKFRRCTLVESVLGIQARHVHSPPDRKAGALRFACEAISFSSVLFAHQLAVAAFDRDEDAPERTAQ
eukprot:CAMPEP_0172441926 /NCGR_PEP_ID=MMETSP1065-20121228/2438_1 /TAXON_ID=265537 /ORGANISM="Amphiprora paludosa, Strain CCMP125" /LENGTH=284 /DNA_ID=CAMNT_0013191553 /DNA_START=159 /DNA_END=1013 /DNA_ORIENTATION=-